MTLTLAGLSACGEAEAPDGGDARSLAQPLVQEHQSAMHAVAASRGCGPVDGGDVPASYDAIVSDLDAVVVQHVENNLGQLVYACEGSWEFAIPEALDDSNATLEQATLFINEQSGYGLFELTGFAGDGEGALDDFTAPAEPTVLGTFSSSSFGGLGGLDITALIEDLRGTSSFVGIKVSPSGPGLSSSTFQGLSSDPPISGQLAYVLFEYSEEVNTAPSIVVTQPRPQTTVSSGDAVTFQAFASDPEDGNLNASIEWASDLSGPLGVGSLITIELPAGEHIVTASVADSAGATTASIPIPIIVLPPPDPCEADARDSDGDGVCNALDQCWGFDDTLDADADGIPDACDGLLTVGYSHTCATAHDGPLTCWGWNFYGQADPPAGIDFAMVTAGQAHTCGLTFDGFAHCWGDGRQGQTAAPENVQFRELTAGWAHTCGLLMDGSISCWGQNDKGQADAPTGNDFVSVKPARFHTCALRGDGTLQCWGDATFDRTNPPAGSYVQLSAHSIHSCLLDATKTASCWGATGWGMSSPPTDVRFAQLSTSWYDACGLAQDGTLHCWGPGFWGNTDAPTGTGYTQVAAFALHACARKPSDGIVCWGNETTGTGRNVVPPEMQ